MAKKLLKILYRLTGDDADFELELDDRESPDEDVGYALIDLGEEIKKLELSGGIDDEVLDILKAVLIYILIKDGSYERDEIYSLIYGSGKRIIWN